LIRRRETRNQSALSVWNAACHSGDQKRESTTRQEATMGKRTGQRVSAEAKDLSSEPDRATKVKGGQLKAAAAVKPPKPVSITDGTSNTIMFGEVVHRP